jgi:ParB family chromosome partitioning protein
VFAGAFISIDHDGELRVERGYVRPEDEPRTELVEAKGEDGAEPDRKPVGGTRGAGPHGIITASAAVAHAPAAEDDEGLKPLSERLLAELTAFRTIALQHAVANNPHVAMTVLLHKLCLDTFQHGAHGHCLEAAVREVYFQNQPTGLKDSLSAKSATDRHDAWAKNMPRDKAKLWNWLTAVDDASRAALLAHCVSLGVNALYEKPNPRSGSGISQHGLTIRLRQANRVACAVSLDMVAAGWSPTVDNYLGRVPKVRILEAVREAKGDASIQLIEHLKKLDMAKEAERLLAGTGWLLEPLRTPDVQAEEAECESDAEELPAFLDDEEECADE